GGRGRRPRRSRYAGAGAVGGGVQHWLADEPVAACRELPTARLGRWARRHKPAVTGLAALLATAMTAVVVGAVLLEQEQSRTAAARGQAAAEKVAVEIHTRQELESQLYDHRIALAERELAVHNLNRATQLLAGCPGAYRNWEWYCLQRLCHADLLTLHGHTAAVGAVAFSPDGKL